MNILTNLDKFKEDAIRGLREGKSLSGKDGVLTPLIKSLLEAALDAEMDLYQFNFVDVHIDSIIRYYQ